MQSRADYASIIDESRGRQFDEAEKERIQIMIAEGYGQRTFGNLILDTDRRGFQDTLSRLAVETARMIHIDR